MVPAEAGAGKCASPDYARCAEWTGPGASAEPRCPYLDESLMQFCGATATRKFVPYNGSSLSRCAGEAYRYCEAYLEAAMPARAGAACPPVALADPREEWVGGIRVPTWLLYARNHLWLDPAGDGICHVGIDALFARTLEAVEQVSFLTLSGTARPSVVLTARGIDVLVVFPAEMPIAAPNLYLRANPSKVVRDPYTLGWLFQVQQSHVAKVRDRLLAGEAAVAWMRREAERLLRYPQPSGREDLIRMFHEFFSPMASREIQA